MQEARTVLLGGVPTLLHLEDPILAAALFDALGDCPPAGRPAELAITDRRPAFALPAEEPGEVHHAVRIWRRGDALLLSWNDTLIARADDQELSFAPVRGAGYDATRAVRQLLPYTLGHLLGARGRVVLHAGALLVDDGAVLVLGATGAGKSTLVYAARAAGRRVLADDLVVLTHRDGVLEASGIPRPLAVATDRPHELPPNARAIGDDVRGRWQFPLEGVPGCHRVGGVVVVEHGVAPAGHLETLTASALWDATLASFVAATDPHRLRAAMPALAAVSRFPGWRLGHGCDAGTRLVVAAALLDGITMMGAHG